MFTNTLRGCLAMLALAMFAGCSDNTTNPSTAPPHEPAPQSGVLSTGGLNVRVDLSAIRDQIAPSAKIFVFIRKAGERMPLMVEAFALDDLPPIVQFSTTEQLAEVSVFARVSASGKVEKSAGDFEAMTTGRFANPAKIFDINFTDSATNQPVAEPGGAAGVSSVEINIELAIPQNELVQFPDSARLFVIAKAPGSPVPLAVKAYPVKAVPKQLVLSDKDAMMPTRPLSSAKKIEISARLSRSGSVSREPGDWEGLANSPNPDAPTKYNVRIDQRIN